MTGARPFAEPLAVIEEKQEAPMLTMTKSRYTDLLENKKSRLFSIHVFQNIPHAVLSGFEAYQTVKKLPKGSSIFLEDDPADFIWFVLSGHIKETNYLPNGRILTLGRVGTNGMFGVSALEGGKYGFHCLAETETTVLAFPIRVFRTFIEKYPPLALAVATDIARTLRHSREARMLSHEPAEKRVIHVLMELAEDFHDAIPMTRKEIADMTGTSTETCIRIMARFKQEGFLTGAPGRTGLQGIEELLTREYP